MLKLSGDPYLVAAGDQQSNIFFDKPATEFFCTL